MAQMKQDLSFLSPLGKIRVFSYERRIPDEILSEWYEKVKSLDCDSEKEAYAESVMAFMEEHYPIPPKEEFLQEAEESRDWEYLRYRIHHYWDDIPSMLPDAVRVGTHHLVAEIAPHCLFNNKELQTEYLALAPDEATRKALTNQVMIDQDKDYEEYPFSCVYNNIHSKYKFKTIGCKVLSMPNRLQKTLWQTFLKHYVHATEQELYQLLTYGPKRNASFNQHIRISQYGYFLFCLGYEKTSSGFVHKPIPEYWLTSEEYTDLTTDDERINAGLTGMLVLMQKLGWNIKRNRICNYFGCTGYEYLKSAHRPEKTRFRQIEKARCMRKRPNRTKQEP